MDIFNISELKCAYIPGTTALEMKKLSIPSGKLVFVIGKSGIGKSTFIETLGLMNNTMVSDANTEVKFGVSENQTVELSDAWNLPNLEMSDLRKKYFSFIFQNTNLMPNFTAGENMMTSLLIEGKPVAEAKKKVLEVMSYLSLPHEIFDRKTTELSGGQRQRLAFVRAVISDFVVLFGDEPTGNLDEKTAADLMGVLKNLITSDQKTGIIVSHDLKLAHDFADIIIPLTGKMKDGEIVHGEVNLDNVMTNEGGSWNNSKGEKIPDPLEYFSQYLS